MGASGDAKNHRKPYQQSNHFFCSRPPPKRDKRRRKSEKDDDKVKKSFEKEEKSFSGFYGLTFPKMLPLCLEWPQLTGGNCINPTFNYFVYAVIFSARFMLPQRSRLCSCETLRFTPSIFMHNGGAFRAYRFSVIPFFFICFFFPEGGNG